VSPASAIAPDHFATFGTLLKFLRQRAGLTQRELSIAVGYTESHISRLEHEQRAPDAAVVAARFVPALGLETEPAWVARLLALAGSPAAREAAAPSPPVAGPLPGNLPGELTAFVGRQTELATIGRRLADPTCRLLTLTGAGGVGKTRLALQAAAELRAHFKEGAWFVALASVPAPEAVVFALGNALGLRFSGPETPASQLLRHLRGRHALLVLDNFEHVLPAAELLTALLPEAPDVKLLVTSRERLGV
jgi:hypothetical protein